MNTNCIMFLFEIRSSSFCKKCIDHCLTLFTMKTLCCLLFLFNLIFAKAGLMVSTEDLFFKLSKSK